MDFSALKHFFFSTIAGLFSILFLSGCIAMELERPLSGANEFQDANLDGVWMMSEKGDPGSKETFVFEMKNVEKHHYSLLWMLPSQVTFTLSQIPDGKQGAYRFASIVADDPANAQNGSCMLVRYTSSPDEIGVYNVTKTLQDQEDYKKLCKDPSKKDLVTAGPDEIRKWCADHAEEMELIFTLKRVRFKTDADRQKFLHISAFFQDHNRRMAVIFAGAKGDVQISKERVKEIRAEFETVRKWMSESKEMISPELAVSIDQYLSIPLDGRSCQEAHHEIDVLMQLIRRITYTQLVN